MNIISNLVEAHIFRETENGIEFLLLKRAADQIYPGVWQMVSGKINDNEKAFETSVREIEEETGLTPEKMWVAPKVNSFYSAVSDTICLIPVFAAQVAKDSNVIISAEHSECTWVNPREAKELLAWDGQRRAIDLIEEYYLNEKSLLKFIKIDL
ncbi:MAG: NUDIX pyrophosphatase [Bacteroidetes bacterium]|nr:NUDIX pyrophosphatase [Bacteroidota bacterium]MCH7771449.1 NUDIX pyrophosphatase [Bacteroidota bacterium]